MPFFEVHGTLFEFVQCFVHYIFADVSGVMLIVDSYLLCISIFVEFCINSSHVLCVIFSFLVSLMDKFWISVLAISSSIRGFFISMITYQLWDKPRFLFFFEIALAKFVMLLVMEMVVEVFQSVIFVGISVGGATLAIFAHFSNNVEVSVVYDCYKKIILNRPNLHTISTYLT